MKSINENSFTGSHFYIGIDTHLKNWRVTIRLNGIELNIPWRTPQSYAPALPYCAEPNKDKEQNKISASYTWVQNTRPVYGQLPMVCCIY